MQKKVKYFSILAHMHEKTVLKRNHDKISRHEYRRIEHSRLMLLHKWDKGITKVATYIFNLDIDM